MCTPRTAAISSARRPSSVSRIARARSASPRCSDFDRARNTACSAASAVSFDFPGICGLRSPHPKKITHSIAHSQAGCLGIRDGTMLVERLAGNAGLSHEAVDEIVKRADGVPLFVEELTKAVLETGDRDNRVAAVLTASPL